MKENKSLFYVYFVGFLILAYLGRSIISPNEHHFALWMQLIALFALPYIYKNLLSSSKFLSGVFFFLSLVLVFEISNYIPVFALTIFSLFFVYTDYAINTEFYYIFKPLFIIGFLLLNFKSTVLFFSALRSDKNYTISNNSKSFKAKTNITEDNSKNYIPKNVYVYFDEISQILTFCINKNESSKFKQLLYFTKKFKKSCLLSKKSSLDYSLLLKDNILYIKSNKNTIVIDYEEFPASLKDIVNEIIENKNKEQKED